eukprot:gene123-734_t
MAAKNAGMKNCAKPTMEMKRRAVHYYNENNVPKCLEELLNTMFLENPSDIFGYMSEYFSQKSKTPTISKIEFKDALSGRGYDSFITSIHCLINGIEKPVCDVGLLIDDGPKVETQRTKSKPTTGSKSKSDKKLATAVASIGAAASISQIDATQSGPKDFDYETTREDIANVCNRLIGQSPQKQSEMDEFIRSCLKEVHDARSEEAAKEKQDEEAKGATAEGVGGTETSSHDVLCDDCLRRTKVDYSELYMSLLTAKFTSELKKVELFESLTEEYTQEEDRKFILPSPMLLLMKCGTESLGKLNLFRGVYVVPKLETSLVEGFRQISSVYRELGNILQQKLGVNGRLVNRDGSYSPCLEKPEQMFEYLQTAFTAANVDMDSSVDLILDIGATYFYEEEKKKYEVSTGNFRTSEEMLLMYADFIEKYPVIGIIDGMSHKDIDGCSQLTKQLSGKCFCFGDSLLAENVDLLDDRIEDQTCNGVVIRLGSYFNNLTELREISSRIKDNKTGIIMPTITAQGCSSQVVADLATAIGATFIAMGAPTHDQNTDVCNRLMQIEGIVKAKDVHETQESYSFPEYKEEEVEEPSEGQEE